MDLRETTARVWALLGGDPALLEAVGYRGPGGLLAARLPVMGLARASVAVCALAAAELAARRSATAARLPQLDRGGTRSARLALAQTADWLMHRAPAEPDVTDRPGADDPAPWLTETPSALGLIRHARSPVRFDGRP